MTEKQWLKEARMSREDGHPDAAVAAYAFAIEALDGSLPRPDDGGRTCGYCVAALEPDTKKAA